MSLEVGSESEKHRLFLTCFICPAAVMEDVSEHFRSSCPACCSAARCHTVPPWQSPGPLEPKRKYRLSFTYVVSVVVLSQSNRKVTNHFPSAALQVCATTPDFQLQYKNLPAVRWAPASQNLPENPLSPWVFTYSQPTLSTGVCLPSPSLLPFLLSLK